MFSAAIIASLALVPAAFATVFITEPVATTSWAAGQQQTLTWEDDGKAPTLASFGLASVGIYVGNALVQTQVQQITPSVNVSTTGSIVFTPDATIGPNSGDYFIRFQSLALLQNGTSYPEEAFSAKFALSSMSGQFNAAESSEISGASTAPLGGSASSAASPSASTTPAASSTKAASSAASSAHSSASPSASGKSNGAASLAVSGLTGVAGIVVAVLAASLL